MEAKKTGRRLTAGDFAWGAGGLTVQIKEREHIIRDLRGKKKTETFEDLLLGKKDTGRGSMNPVAVTVNFNSAIGDGKGKR